MKSRVEEKVLTVMDPPGSINETEGVTSNTPMSFEKSS